MKNTHILFFLFLCLSNIIKIYNSTLKQKSNPITIKNKDINRFKQRNNKKIFANRKLPDYLTCVPLKILIDTGELFSSCPPELTGYIDNIVNAMKKAKEILEDFINICVDPSQDVNIEEVERDYDFSHSSDFLDNSFNLIDNYNFFIFEKFIGYDTDNYLIGETGSLILKKYSGVPCMGIIFLNFYIGEINLNADYLTPLMLHHFIKLFGFDTIGTELLKENFNNVIEYAQKYFYCADIESINLSFGYGGKYSDNYLIGVYWPKRLLLGELLTEYDYPEEQVLSGFTLALLKDLGYLKITKEYYTGGLMRF